MINPLNISKRLRYCASPKGKVVVVMLGVPFKHRENQRKACCFVVIINHSYRLMQSPLAMYSDCIRAPPCGHQMNVSVVCAGSWSSMWPRKSSRRHCVLMMWRMWLNSTQLATWTCCVASRACRPGITHSTHTAWHDHQLLKCLLSN